MATVTQREQEQKPEESVTRHQGTPGDTETPRPDSRADSGDSQDGAGRGSADRERRRPDSALSDKEFESLQQRVKDTEAWVERLKNARAEGTRISQGRETTREEPRRGGKVFDENGNRRSQMPSDVENLKRTLDSGDDARFLNELLDASTQRALSQLGQERDNAALVDRIEKIVEDAAPDVPLPLFWHFTEDAIRAIPNDMPKQIEMTIGLCRRAMKQRDERVEARREANNKNRQNGETLGRGGAGPRRDATDDGDKSSMVDDIRSFQRSKV